MNPLLMAEVESRWNPSDAFDYLASRRRVTTVQLARASGIEREVIDRLRRGLRRPSIGHAIRLTVCINAFAGSSYGVDELFEIPLGTQAPQPDLLASIDESEFELPPFTYAGSRLDYIMNFYGLANSAVAKASRVNHTTVSRLRRGIMRISKGKARQITKGLCSLIKHEYEVSDIFPVDSLRDRMSKTLSFANDRNDKRQR